MIDTACQSFKPIHPSVRDDMTAGTMGQILAHNRQYRATCAPKEAP